MYNNPHEYLNSLIALRRLWGAFLVNRVTFVFISTVLQQSDLSLG